MSKSKSIQIEDGEIVAFDIGEKRIGVARVNTVVNLPEPVQNLDVTPDTQLSAILGVIETYNPVALVVGLPRGLEGQETAQTAVVRRFVDDLKTKTSTPIYCIDEAGTSKEAIDRLKGRPGSIDSVAAMIMLEDFINCRNKQELLV